MKPELKRILWPTDFSELSLKAGQYAKSLRKQVACELHIINTCDVPLVPSVMIPPDCGVQSVAAPDVVEAAQKKLHMFIAEHLGGDTTIVRDVIIGTPWLEICNYAEREEIDLIVMATHGLTGIRHILMGSTAERVVQHAKCPVLVVKSIERGCLTDDLRNKKKAS